MTDTRIHPESGKILRRDTRSQTVTVGSLSRVVEVPGWYPNDDSDSIHTGADLKASNDAFQQLRTEYGALVKTVRKSLNLSQEEAGWIIGGGRRAFQKYESGKTPPSVAAVGLFEILRRHPEEIDVLRRLHKPVPAAGSVIAKVVKRRAGSQPKAKTPQRPRGSAHT